MKSWNKKKILEIDKKHIWHPYTQMKDYENRDPLVIVAANGCKLKTIDGDELYDSISSWWTTLHGHLHPKLNQAIMEQLKLLDHVNFSGYTHPYAVEVVERLKNFLPHTLSRFFFSDNGSTAVEVALKMAFQFWQNRGVNSKTRFVCLENAYHGDTLGAVSVGGVDLFFELYKPLLFKSFKAPSPYCYRCEEKEGFTLDANHECNLRCLDGLEKILNEHHEEICAVIVEPRLQGAGGILVYPAAYLKKLREITEQFKVFLIFDEVATGFGRTGTMFAFEQAGIAPDIICLAKGLTGGYLPMALTVTTEEIYQAFYADYLEGKTFYHGHTYTANPICCAVAAASLKLFAEEEPLVKTKEAREYFHQLLLDTFSDKPYVGDIRYIGYVGAIELVRDKKTKEPFSEELRLGFNIYMKSLEKGVVLRPLGDVIYWFLPLCISKTEVEEILKISAEVIEEVLINL
ncbi:adenosylmethionine-8-amino-7-oxononanoate aminotransferase [Thermodesulfatator indicus DSM 15286]|uniref:Adenosylmethionine-8-amino-7-oxononanoate aminotransferase n=1 Tax=Thermodesulfatator indicus (strain DSM 15286 / JCM 11887 / CIR29812) TaxID=667014 RepID=F8A7Z8_THEID|nr:adenosylmethionine--8-amino-7-oxononanoate transaminase [Thermodesulfatator indicus]AEH43914.1 adenosylmethionine-8-amino-7-oxononanoate aminotransferase [Thermodesulfatator indicus DSM 15286]